MAKQGLDPKKITLARISRTEAYAEKVRLMFARTVNDILALNKTMPELDEGVMFSFDGESIKKQKEVEALLRRLHSAVTMAIEQGIKLEWEQANQECDKLIASVFGKKVIESPEFSAWMGRNSAARDAFIDRSENGLNLSDRVWKSVRQLRDEMEVAMTVSIGEGESASSMSRKVREYLNNPDDMFRRFRYKKGEKDIIDPETGEVTGTEIIWGKKWKKRIKDEATGKYKWINYDRDDYKTGSGVYKSSARNAMRVACTETNIAYRRADNARWQDMDFVLGQRVQLSRNHPKKDICDKLAGDYPKDFVFDGWHPQCFCFCTPILMDEDEMAKVTEAFLKGETYTPKGKPITDYPQNFKEWVTEHQGDIAAARERGTEPYFIRNNAQAIDEIINPFQKELSILEKAKLRHDARTPEQEEAIKNAWQERKHKHALIKKTAGNVLNVAQGYGEIDYSELQAAIDAGDLTKMQELSKTVAHHVSAMKKQEAAISDLIPDAHQWHKQFTMKELINTYTAVETKLNKIAGETLAKQQKILEDEIVYIEDPTKFKPHTIYPTYKVAQSAYLKKLNEVKYKIDVQAVQDQLNIVDTWSAAHPKSLNVANLLADAQASLSAGEDIAIIKQKAQLAVAEYQKRLAEQARRDAKKGNIVFAEMKPETVQDLLDKYEVNTVAKMDKSLRPITETVWATLTDEERLILTKYTQTYSYLNEPLRGISYSGYRDKSEYTHDLPILTSALNKFKTAKDMVVRRGTGNYYIPELGKDLNMVKVGEEFTDGGFLSTAAHRTKGFFKSYNMIILVPKGARGAFAEPFSHFTDSGTFDFDTNDLWDGVSKESIQSEFEWIGQRGSRFRVLKVEGSNIYLQMIGQLR